MYKLLLLNLKLTRTRGGSHLVFRLHLILELTLVNTYRGVVFHISGTARHILFLPGVKFESCDMPQVSLADN